MLELAYTTVFFARLRLPELLIIFYLFMINPLLFILRAWFLFYQKNRAGHCPDEFIIASSDQQAFQTAPMDGLLQYADPSYAGSTNAFYRVNVVP